MTAFIIYAAGFVLVSVIGGLIDADMDLAILVAIMWPFFTVMLLASAPYHAANALGRWASKS